MPRRESPYDMDTTETSFPVIREEVVGTVTIGPGGKFTPQAQALQIIAEHVNRSRATGGVYRSVLPNGSSLDVSLYPEPSADD